MFDAAPENIVLIPVASLPIAAMRNNAIKTTSSPYSTRSWPSSSFQSRFIKPSIRNRLDNQNIEHQGIIAEKAY